MRRLSRQFKDNEPQGQKLGKAQVTRWRVGMIVKASGGACRGLAGYVPVPTDWPEQEVQTVEESVSPSVKISYETVDGGVRIMNVKIAQLPAGQEAKALVTVEIRRRAVLPPERHRRLCASRSEEAAPADPAAIFCPVPKIECRDPKNPRVGQTDRRRQGKSLGEGRSDLRLGPQEGEVQEWPVERRVAALKDGTGDCEEITSLFIAICRAADIPARTVRVPGHCYPEFYLCDGEGRGHWFPCQSAGTREFGGISELRPILQKGDNFRPPKNSKQRQRYMAESSAAPRCPAAASRRSGLSARRSASSGHTSCAVSKSGFVMRLRRHFSADGIRSVPTTMTTIDDLLAKLNPQQREAATHGDGPLLIVAARAPARPPRWCIGWRGWWPKASIPAAFCC